MLQAINSNVLIGKTHILIRQFICSLYVIHILGRHKIDVSTVTCIENNVISDVRMTYVFAPEQAFSKPMNPSCFCEPLKYYKLKIGLLKGFSKVFK